MALAYLKRRQAVWRQAIAARFSRSRRSHSHPAVISLHQTELVLAQRTGEKLHFIHQACDSVADWPDKLGDLVQEHQLRGRPIHLILPAGSYQLLAADKPDNIPDEDLAGAVIWSQSDLLEDNPADVIADVFDMPGAINENRINLVVSRRDRLSSLVQALLSAHGQPEGISIQELALRSVLGQPEHGVMLLIQLPGQEMQLLIVRGGQLYINRQLRGMDRLLRQSAEALASGALDSLSLEIQRSMDYFVSQLRQSPVSQVLIATSSDNDTTIASLLEEFFSVPVKSLLAHCQEQQQLDSLSLTELVALGGLLEQEAGDA